MISDKRVLDLGCGRGGGLAFLSKYYEPEEAVGVDLSRQQIQFCEDNYSEVEGLSFAHVISNV